MQQIWNWMTVGFKNDAVIGDETRQVKNGNGYFWNSAAGLLNAGEAVAIDQIFDRIAIAAASDFHLFIDGVIKKGYNYLKTDYRQINKKRCCPGCAILDI